MTSLLIKNGSIVTMNHKREIIQNGAIAVDNGIILAVGKTDKIEKEYPSETVIDATRKLIMPGLIDTHGHAGHGLIKTIAEYKDFDWVPIVEKFYFEDTTPYYWYIEAKLSALERIKFGVTTGLSYIGSSNRTDKPIYALEHNRGASEIGIRDVVAVGPSRPPYPTKYRSLIDTNKPEELFISFDEAIKTSLEVANKLRSKNDKSDVVLSPSSITIGDLDSSKKAITDLPDWKEKLEKLGQVSKENNLNIHTHAYGEQVKFIHDNLPNANLLGPHVSLAHCAGLSQVEVEILAKTNTRVSHGPSARSIIPARCPVIEMLDSGVVVSISTDGSAPDRTFDLFKEIRQAMSLQRHHFHNGAIFPPGKGIEMVTIDAAKTLGYDKHLGSLEVDKQADIILIDLMQPHLIPMFMFPHRIAYEVSGQDVDTVIVNGEILMEGRKMTKVDEIKILEAAQKEALESVDRSNLRQYMELPDNFWGHSRY